MANRHYEADRLASEQIALFDSVGDPMSMFAVMSAAMFAKLHAGEVAEAVRVAQAVVDLLAGDATKGNISGWDPRSRLRFSTAHTASRPSASRPGAPI